MSAYSASDPNSYSPTSPSDSQNSTTIICLLLGLSFLFHWYPQLYHQPISTLRGIFELVNMSLNRILASFSWNFLKGIVNDNVVDWDSLAELTGNEEEDEADTSLEEEGIVGPQMEGVSSSKGKGKASSSGAGAGAVAAALKLESNGKFRSARPGEYYPGLLNAAGNLCFLNATLQSLASTTHLLTYLARTLHINSTLPVPLSLPVTTSLLAILTALNTPSLTPYPPPLRPLELAHALANSSPSRKRLLMSREQQDAQELLGIIREALGEEVERVRKRVWEGIEDGGSGLAGVLGLMSGGGSFAGRAWGAGLSVGESGRWKGLMAGGAESTSVGDVGEVEGREGAEKQRQSGRAMSTRKRNVIKDPFLHLVSQKVMCMTCGYTRDVKHLGEEQVVLPVPPHSICSLEELLQEYTKMDMITDYACQKCGLLATYDKLVAQRDRLSLPVPSSSTSSNIPSSTSNTSISSSVSSNFAIPSPPIATTAPTMTQSRKDRRKKVQKLVDRVEKIISAGDFEKELGEDIKFERVGGLAGKQDRFARTPDILTFHLNRSNYARNGSAIKNFCQVTFPEILDLSPFSDYPPPPSPSSSPEPSPDQVAPPLSVTRDLYRLSSLVVHYGTHSFGHYVGFRRKPMSPIVTFADVESSQERASRNEWYRVSDETVEVTSLNEVLKSNPFMLFYERISEREGIVRVDREEDALVPRVVESWTLKEE